MPAYAGSSAPSAFKVGSQDCTALYVGSTLVWSAAPTQTTYATETYTSNWAQWTAINTGGSNSIASNVGTLTGPTNNSSGATGYQTRRMILSAAGAQADMSAYVEFRFTSLQEQYLDIGIRAQNVTGQANPKGVYASFYPAAASTDQNYSLSDSDGQYTANEIKSPLAYVANAWYACKIRIKGKRVSVKVWNLSTGEKFGYDLWNSNGSIQGATGYLSLGITNGYNTTGLAQFRNITVKSYLDEAGDTTPSQDTMPTASTVTSSNHTWTLSASNDFTTNVAEGGFRTAYPGIASYTEEQGDTASSVTGGKYSTNKTVSVVNNVLTVNQRVISGTPYGAMILADNYAAHQYGRAQFRARQTDVAGKGGFKFVPLWWPSSNDWADGEIDWPEADNGANFPRPATASYPATYKDPPNNQQRVFYPGIDVFADFDVSGWHVYTVDWAPDAISFYQDGRLVLRMTDTRGIPTKTMRFGFQMETWIGEGTVDPAAAGKVELDWFAIYNYTS